MFNDLQTDWNVSAESSQLNDKLFADSSSFVIKKKKKRKLDGQVNLNDEKPVIALKKKKVNVELKEHAPKVMTVEVKSNSKKANNEQKDFITTQSLPVCEDDKNTSDHGNADKKRRKKNSSKKNKFKNPEFLAEKIAKKLTVSNESISNSSDLLRKRLESLVPTDSENQKSSSIVEKQTICAEVTTPSDCASTISVISLKKRKKKSNCAEVTTKSDRASTISVISPISLKKLKKKSIDSKSKIESDNPETKHILKLSKINKKASHTVDSNSDIESNSEKIILNSNRSQKAPKRFNITQLQTLLSQNMSSPQKDVKLSKDFKDEIPSKNPAAMEGNLKKGKKPSNSPSSLRERMEGRLSSARFRYLNEQLYTSSGDDAFHLFKLDPEAYKVYHQGFSNQVDKWPSNPADLIIDIIKKMPKSTIIADFGCGDAKLAQSLEQKVHSFDLVASNKYVTACNMTKVPLKPSCVDVAVYCLSLMGTDLVKYLTEGSRVMKEGATLLIAEVRSRMTDPKSFIRGIDKLGFSLKSKDVSNKMFVILTFTKTGEIDKKSLPTLTLEPCLYKRR